jgi:hypothetical protein
VALMPSDMRLFILRMGPYFGNVLSMHLSQASKAGQHEEIHMSHELSSLTRLTLDGVTVKWNSRFNLTTLVLCRLYGSKSPSMAELQLIFRNNPRLESISLDRVALKSSVIRPHVDELPRLRLLRLSMPPSCTWHIIARLQIPPSARIKIRTWNDNLQITSIFPICNGRLHPFITLTKDSTLSLRPRSIIIRHSESQPFSTRDVPLVIELPQSISVTLFPTISKVFDLFRLTTLELDFMHPDFLRAEAVQESLTITCKFLESVFNLVTLRVCQALADIVAPVLGELASFPSAICPRLACLSFGDPQQMWWDFPTATNGDVAAGWLKPVVTSLQARFALTRTKLKTLEFIGVGHINRDAANLLFPFVDVIVNLVLCPASPSCIVCSKGSSRRAGWRFPGHS